MTQKLTNQQEKFAQCVAKGMNQSDAYREAYPKSRKWKPDALWCEASTLNSKQKVFQRIKAIKAELFDQLKQEIIYSRKNSFDELTEIQTCAKKEKQYNVATKNEELKGKLLGFYEDVHKHIGDPDNPIETNITIEFVE